MMPELFTCPLCGSAGARRMYAHAGRVYAVCPACSVVARVQGPDVNEVNAHYRDEYACARATLAAVPRRNAAYQQVLNLAERYVPGRGHLLDVGCGFGHLLQLAQQRGWQATGIELSSAMVRAARDTGLSVWQGGYDAAPLRDAEFDAITLVNVLDCLPNPLDALCHCRRWLRPSGVLVVRVPNGLFHRRVWAWQQRLPRLDRWWKKRAWSPLNLYLFSPRALVWAIERAGLRVVATLSAHVAGPANAPAALLHIASFLPRALAPSLIVIGRHPEAV